MTTDATPLALTSTKKSDDGIGERTPFTLNDDPTVLWAVRPKNAQLMNMMRDLTVAKEHQDMAVLLSAYDMFMDTCLDPESSGYLRAEFADPDSPLDVDDLDVVMEAIVGKWYRRPTKKPAGSSGLQRSTGKRSTGRARSKG